MNRAVNAFFGDNFISLFMGDFMMMMACAAGVY